jgi:hypothetical protein
MPNLSFLLPHPFFSPHFFMCEEDDGKVTTDMRADTGVRKCAQFFSGPRGVETEAVRPQTFAKCSKGCCIHLHAPPTPCISHPLQRGIWPPYPKRAL